MKTVVIFANTTKPEVFSVCAQMQEFFESKGMSVIKIELSSGVKDLCVAAPRADIAVSLGGDGTVLTCAFILKGTGIPLIPVKIGTFGYITDTQASEYKAVFEAFERGEARIVSRMMLDACVERNGEVCFSTTVLNDVALTAASRARMVRLGLDIDGVNAAEIKGDGILIATPTGSTAYSLAAGGPVLDASLQGIVINPVCPFTMSSRPLVVGSEKHITIRIPKQLGKLSLTADGHLGFDLENGDVVRVSRSSNDVLLVENPERKFIEVLRDKLGWAGGFN